MHRQVERTSIDKAGVAQARATTASTSVCAEAASTAAREPRWATVSWADLREALRDWLCCVGDNWEPLSTAACRLVDHGRLDIAQSCLLFARRFLGSSEGNFAGASYSSVVDSVQAHVSKALGPGFQLALPD